MSFKSSLGGYNTSFAMSTANAFAAAAATSSSVVGVRGGPHLHRSGGRTTLIAFLTLMVLLTYYLIRSNESGIDGQNAGNIFTQCVLRSVSSQESYRRSDNSTIGSLKDVCTGLGYLDGKFPTDKCTRHEYVFLYDALFAKLRRLPAIRLLEIGVKQGGSIKMWREYFSAESTIFGLDINPGVPQFPREPNIKIMNYNSAEPMHFPSFLTPRGCLSVVVDDGYHSLSTQVATLSNFQRYLCSGPEDQAFYIIEDVAPGVKTMLEDELRALGYKFFVQGDKSGEYLIVLEFIGGKSILPLSQGAPVLALK